MMLLRRRLLLLVLEVGVGRMKAGTGLPRRSAGHSGRFGDLLEHDRGRYDRKQARPGCRREGWDRPPQGSSPATATVIAPSPSSCFVSARPACANATWPMHPTHLVLSCSWLVCLPPQPALHECLDRHRRMNNLNYRVLLLLGASYSRRLSRSLHHSISPCASYPHQLFILPTPC